MALPTYNFEEIVNAFERADYAYVLENAMPHSLAGNPDAQCTVALLYQLGFGVERNLVEAERWLLRATEQNSALAWNNLGSLYAMKYPELKGRWHDAHKCWQRAAELGFDVAYPYPPE